MTDTGRKPKVGAFMGSKAQGAYHQAYDALAARWPVPSEETTVETSYGPTHVRRSGSGDAIPVILLHGLNGSGLSWYSVVEDLARDRVVYAPDVIGTAGRSRQTVTIESGDDYATWGAEILDGLGLEKVHILGYSEGAWFATLIASKVGDRAVSVILGEGITTLVPASKEVVRRMIKASMWPTKKSFAKFNDWLSPGVEVTEEDSALARAATKYRRRSPWPEPVADDTLRSITAPVFGFFGEESKVGDPAAAAERLSAEVPDASVEIVGGAGHSVLWQFPEIVLPLVHGAMEQAEDSQN